MNAAGVVAAAPWLRTAPSAEVNSKVVASEPVAKAAVDGTPVMPEVMMNAPETLS